MPTQKLAYIHDRRVVLCEERLISYFTRTTFNRGFIAYMVRLSLIFWLSLAAQYLHAETLVIITNSQNGNETISKSELINIFMGRYRQFANGLPAKPIDNLAYKQAFYQALVNKSPAEINAYWARLIFSGRTHPPINATDSNETLALLMKEPYAISYVQQNQIDKNNPKIRVLMLLEASND